MTQLVGRILRQPQAAKTGRPALDGCWVLCHDIGTAEVVKRVKAALEGEGMGDLALRVHDGSGEPVSPTRVRQTRRTELRALRLFVPRVVWVEDDGSRRELVYDSDVLARLPWQRLDAGRLADGWLPDQAGAQAAHLRLGLDLLDGQVPGTDAAPAGVEGGLDAARIVRGLVDLAPNPWQVWDWVQQVRSRLQARGLRDGRLARSSASLLERLRVDLEQERDRLAQQVFDELVAAGRIEFRLRADAADYELPHEQFVDTGTEPMPLLRDGLHPMQHSLLVPALRTPDLNEFEAAVAGYLDEQQALRWWHRNVARAQYGLQGWKRHKVYPDFVFAMLTADGRDRFVVVETKGLHLANADTEYKQALLARLGAAFRDERPARAGELRLEGPGVELVCDLVFDQQWREALQQRHFARD
jgi:type III restriction enzyme